MYKRERKLPPSVRADLQCVVKKVLYTERRVPYAELVYIFIQSNRKILANRKRTVQKCIYLLQLHADMRHKTNTTVADASCKLCLVLLSAFYLHEIYHVYIVCTGLPLFTISIWLLTLFASLIFVSNFYWKKTTLYI